MFFSNNLTSEIWQPVPSEKSASRITISLHCSAEHRQHRTVMEYLASTKYSKCYTVHTSMSSVSTHVIMQYKNWTPGEQFFYPLLNYIAEISAVWPQACRVCGRKSRKGFGRRGRRQPVSREPSLIGPRQGLCGLKGQLHRNCMKYNQHRCLE
jgi:hypothetical protein